MEFEFKKDELAIIAEVREFLKRETTPELVAETRKLGANYGGPEARKLMRKFAAHGWLTPNWPKEYGGLGLSEMATYMIKEEISYALWPGGSVAAHLAGPTILRVGSEEMKNEFLPRIARGEIEFALGYTEPQAGSDLVALNIKAEDKGNYFLVNGQKTFNTHTHIADYHWLAARTDQDAPKHKGISMMIVDLKSSGITVRPMITMAGWQTNEVFYDNVEVPRKNLVGEKNKGFYYMMAALDFERMLPLGAYRNLFDGILAYAKETYIGGKPLAKDPLIRQKLAQMAIEIEATKLLYYQLAYLLDKGSIPNYQSSMEKMFATEVMQHITQTGMEVLNLFGQLKEDSKWAPLAGRVEHCHRWSVVETIYAGTSEIQRNIIAQRGLGLPRQ